MRQLRSGHDVEETDESLIVVRMPLKSRDHHGNERPEALSSRMSVHGGFPFPYDRPGADEGVGANHMLNYGLGGLSGLLPPLQPFGNPGAP
jgi:hypothetical protein